MCCDWYGAMIDVWIDVTVMLHDAVASRFVHYGSTSRKFEKIRGVACSRLAVAPLPRKPLKRFLRKEQSTSGGSSVHLIAQLLTAVDQTFCIKRRQRLQWRILSRW